MRSLQKEKNMDIQADPLGMKMLENASLLLDSQGEENLWCIYSLF